MEEVQNYLKENDVDIMEVSEVDIMKTSYHHDYPYEIEGYFHTKAKSWEELEQSRIILYCKDSMKQFITIRLDLMTREQPDIFIEVSLPKEQKNICCGLFLKGMEVD